MAIEIKNVEVTPPKPIPVSEMKLGRLPVVEDVRTFKLGNYLDDSQLPKIPDSYIWNTGIKQWGIMKNDEIGDCTVAAAGHLIMGWSNDVGKSVESKKDIPTEVDKQDRVMMAGVAIVSTIIVSTIIYLLVKRRKK